MLTDSIPPPTEVALAPPSMLNLASEQTEATDSEHTGLEHPAVPMVVRSRDELIAVGIPIVRRLAFRLARRLPPNVDVQDLIGAGTEGLLKAIEGYDQSRYPAFEPYAELRIRGAILDELRIYDPMTRHGRRRMTEVSRAIKNLEAELGRTPNEDEVAKSLDLNIDQYRKLTEELSRAPALGRLGESDPDEIASDFGNPFDLCDSRQLRTRLVEAIDALPERTKMVLALYYQEQATQAEIGKILNITESRVCQILGESTVRLRAALGVEVNP